MPTYAQFDEGQYEKVVALVKAHHEAKTEALRAAGQSEVDLRAGHLKALGGCISATVSGGQVCVSLPIVGNVCLPIPLPLPDGTSVQACFSICFTVFIPTGVELTVSYNGNVIIQQSFGAGC